MAPKQTFEKAARHGDLNVLEWLRANDCPWDKETCEDAARNGHVNILEWARETVALGIKVLARLPPEQVSSKPSSGSVG